MADRDGILGKIRALLNTAAEDSGATEGERTNAIVMAQRLMNKYRIEEHELAKGGKAMPSGIKSEDGGDYKQGRMWIVDVMEAVAGPMTVDVINRRYVGGSRATLVGRPEAIAYVRLATEWVVPQLSLACDAALIIERNGAKNAGVAWSWGETIRFKRSFFFGATRRLRDRLEEIFEEEQEETGACTDLVVSDRQAVDDYYASMGMKVRMRAVTIAGVDASGATAGARAANRVDLDPSNKVSRGAARELGC